MRRALILTALTVEIRAVIAHLKGIEEERLKQGTIYRRGTFERNDRLWEVTVAIVGKGNNNAATQCERAINHCDPHVALFVGVAGGLKKDLKTGDVVVANHVYAYESGKDVGELLSRPHGMNSHYRLLAVAESLITSGDWTKQIRPRLRAHRPEAYIGLSPLGRRLSEVRSLRPMHSFTTTLMMQWRLKWKDTDSLPPFMRMTKSGQ